MLLQKIGAAVISTVMTITSMVCPSTAAKLESIDSVTKVRDNFYIMDYTYDYNINDIAKNGYLCTADMIVQVAGDFILGKPVQNFGCSTFNAVTPEGEHIFGRNFDYMDAPSMLVRTNPKDGYASIAMLNLDLIGYKYFTPDTPVTKIISALAPYAIVDGINETGLSIGVLEIEKDPTFQLSPRKNITTSSMVRIVLDKASTVEEAVRLFGNYDMRDLLTDGCTYHYHIADANGDSAVIEYVNNRMVVVYPEENEENAVDYQCATNFLLTPGAYDPNGLGQDRYEVMMNKLNETKGVLSEEEAADLLQDVSVQDEDMNGYICSTLWSCVYNNETKSVKLYLYNNFEDELVFDVFSSLKSQKQ